MDATANPVTWRKTVLYTAIFAVLFGCAFLFPPLAFGMSLVLPLWVCPAFARGKLWLALALPVAPASAFLVSGGDPVFSLLLVALPPLCFVAITIKQQRRWSFSAEVIACSAAFILATLGMLARLSELLDGPLFERLSETLVNAIQGSYLSGNILYRAVNIGLLPMPEAFQSTAALQLGSFIWLTPDLQKELLNMLRLRLTEGFTLWIPSLLVQGAILFGLFTALATERAQTRKIGERRILPSFQHLRLPRRHQGYMLLLCIGTVVTSLSDQSLVSLLCMLMYAAFSGIYQVLGASVVMFVLSHRHPKRTTLYGVLIAIIYLIFPVALFMLGIADQFINLRTANLRHSDQEEG